MSGYIEDHLIKQPAIQLMKHERGWEVEEGEILDVRFWILDGRGRRLNKNLQNVHGIIMFTAFVNVGLL